jgi:dipeptidyl aminopeptidase/acylaminoacyl peptidase
MGRAIALFLLLSAGAWGQKAPFDFNALMKVARIADPQLSPDGKTVAFTVQRIELENNLRPTQIYAVPLDGGQPVSRQGRNHYREAALVSGF